jgi:hypothetical protein
VVALQGTMPSTLKHPSHVPMWKGVKVAYAIIALCLYPVAIGGFWAYGNQVRVPHIYIHTHGLRTTSRVTDDLRCTRRYLPMAS